jgi:hypothetical protein
LCGNLWTLFVLGSKVKVTITINIIFDIGLFPHDNFSSVYWILNKLGHMIHLWKGKNPIHFGVIRSKVKVTNLDLWPNDPKIKRVLPLPQGNHVAKFVQDPIYRTKVIVRKQPYCHNLYRRAYFVMHTFLVLFCVQKFDMMLCFWSVSSK